MVKTRFSYRLRHGWIRFCLITSRPLRLGIKVTRWLLIGFIVFFSPLIVWIILTVNRDLIHHLANARWAMHIAPNAFSAMREDVNSGWFTSGFNEAALGGLLTLYGVMVTVWYYHAVRQQEVIEKRLFLIDELMEELRKNKRILDGISSQASLNIEISEELVPDGESANSLVFFTEAWHKLGADVALLPRAIHLRLSVLYSCLMDCREINDYFRRKATIDRIPDILSALQKYRRKLSKLEMR